MLLLLLTGGVTAYILPVEDVNKFDDHVTSQHGGYFRNRGFSYRFGLFAFCSVLLTLSIRNYNRDRPGNNGLQMFSIWQPLLDDKRANFVKTKRNASNFTSSPVFRTATIALQNALHSISLQVREHRSYSSELIHLNNLISLIKSFFFICHFRKLRQT